jgi:AraC-like DNA-binding protein
MPDSNIYLPHHRFGIGLFTYTQRHSMLIPHYHDTYEFYLQLEGERYILFHENCYKLTKGDLVIIEPYILHMTESKESEYTKRYLMNMYAPLMKNILTDDELDNLLSKIHTGVIHLNDEQFDYASHIFYNINKSFWRNDHIRTKLLYTATLQLLDFLGDLDASAHVYDDSNINKAVIKALNYIHNNYMKNITLDFICEYANMSKSNFCLVFHKTTSETFIQYLNHIRITHVHRLLAETDLKVYEIAERTGFPTTSYMISIFKQINGISPKQFRMNKKLLKNKID